MIAVLMAPRDIFKSLEASVMLVYGLPVVVHIMDDPWLPLLRLATSNVSGLLIVYLWPVLPRYVIGFPVLRRELPHLLRTFYPGS